MILEVPTDLTGTWCYIITIRCIFNWAPLTCRVPWPGDARQGRWWTHRTWAETSWLKINEAAAGPSSWADFNRSKWASRSGYIQLNKCFSCRSTRILGISWDDLGWCQDRNPIFMSFQGDAADDVARWLRTPKVWNLKALQWQKATSWGLAFLKTREVSCQEGS